MKNELGLANEIGVDARRSKSGATVLEEFRQDGWSSYVI